MTIFQALLLGLVQGLTEFLPVSSSAHLVFIQHLLGFREPLLFFDIMVHWGTLAALFIYFAADIAHLLRDSVYGVGYLFHHKSMQDISEIAPHSRWALGILVASLPTGLMGIFLKDWFEQLFGSLQVVGFALGGTSLLLWLTRFFQKNERGMEKSRYLDYLVIGLFQGLAITPGISRSGATIAAALFLGFKREEAFRFSFLLSIPAILGAGLWELREGLAHWNSGWLVLGAGFLTAALFGYVSLHFLRRIIEKGKLHLFAVYTLLFGCLVFFLSFRLE